jgi:CBS domain-containing protein
MNVEDLMSRHVEFMDSDALVKDAAVLMGELDVGALPIGTPARLEGIVTGGVHARLRWL